MGETSFSGSSDGFCVCVLERLQILLKMKDKVVKVVGPGPCLALPKV